MRELRAVGERTSRERRPCPSPSRRRRNVVWSSGERLEAAATRRLLLLSACVSPTTPPRPAGPGVADMYRAGVVVGNSLQGGDDEFEPVRGIEVVGAAMQPVHEQVPRGFEAFAVTCLFDEPFDRLVTVGFRRETQSRLGDGQQLRLLATHLTAG